MLSVDVWWTTDMRLIDYFKNWFGAPHPQPHDALFDPDLTPEEARETANRQMRDVRLRLERLKLQRDTEGRRP